MMNKINLYRLIAALLLFMGTACSDFLDLEPQSFPTDQNFWKTEEDAEASVAGAYALLRQALTYSEGVTFYAYGDLPSDEYESATGEDWNDIVTMNWSLSIPASSTYRRMQRLRRYDIFYRVVDQCNRIIQFVPAMPDDVFASLQQKNRFLGEAYFLRAFTYFYMNRVWGGVPLVTQSVAPIDAVDQTQNTAAEVSAQVQSDIDQAKGLLTWGYNASEDVAVRANKGSLFALQAHLGAWIGNYSLALEAADSVIERGGYQMVSKENFLRIFQGQSTEGIFEISQNKANEGTNTGIARYSLIEPYLNGFTTQPELTISANAVNNLYRETGDLRLEKAFDLEAGAVPICIKYANVEYTAPTATQAARPIFKNNIVIFRYADIKLLKAEALAALNRDGEAVNILNEIRQEAGLDSWDHQGDLFEEIIDERGRELFLEGHRFYDLIRLAKQKGVLKFGQKMSASEFEAGKYYWPFDPTILSLNKQLVQNPFWSTRL